MLETMMTVSRAMMAYSMGGSWFDPDVGASIRVGVQFLEYGQGVATDAYVFETGNGGRDQGFEAEDVDDAEDYCAGCEGADECEEGGEC